MNPPPDVVLPNGGGGGLPPGFVMIQGTVFPNQVGSRAPRRRRQRAPPARTKKRKRSARLSRPIYPPVQDDTEREPPTVRVAVPSDGPRDPATQWARDCDACGRWHNAHFQTVRPDHDRTVGRLAATLQMLSKRAEALLSGPHFSDGRIVEAVALASQDRDAKEATDHYMAMSFLRCLAQCCEIGLDLCIRVIAMASSADQEESEGSGTPSLESHAHAVASAVLVPRVRDPLWAIMACLERHLFWDPRPFWKSENATAIWMAYTRAYMFACFDRHLSLRIQTEEEDEDEDDEDDDVDPFDPQLDRRPRFTTEDVGLGRRGTAGASVLMQTLMGSAGGLAIADCETWTMSELFEAIDMVSDSWPLVRFTGPIVRAVARIFLRYVALAFAKSSDEDDDPMSAHDLEDYIQRVTTTTEEDSADGPTHQRHWVGVHPDTYYPDGGCQLRDMLADLCVVCRVDCWVQALTAGGDGCDAAARSAVHREPLAKRLWLSMAPASSQEGDVLMRLCHGDRLLPVDGPPPDGLEAEQAERDQWEAKTRRCVEGIAQFLDRRESDQAVKVFYESGMTFLLRPGEPWRFHRRWPDHGCSPSAILNGTRERDMLRYRDHVINARSVSPMMRTPKSALPGDLVTLLDHLSVEAVRAVMHKHCSSAATEALPLFTIEQHQLGSANPDLVWSKASRWCRMVRDAYPQPAHEHRRWNGHIILGAMAKNAVAVSAIPPFPCIILAGGRVFVWNPLAPLMWRRGDAITKRPLVDVSSISMACTLVMWLEIRRQVVAAFRERLRLMASGSARAREMVVRTTAILGVYQEIRAELLGTTEG